MLVKTVEENRATRKACPKISNLACCSFVANVGGHGNVVSMSIVSMVLWTIECKEIIKVRSCKVVRLFRPRF